MTTVINLYGGPGVGKSTSAAAIFYLLKSRGVNAELVREYVKEWAWEGRQIGPLDQFYFLGKQARKESLLYGKVEAIVTDSPVALCLFYAKQYCTPGVVAGIEAAVRAFYVEGISRGQKYFHVNLKRSKAYNPKGRFQTEEEAKALDQQIPELLHSLGFVYEECGTELDSLGALVTRLVR